MVLIASSSSDSSEPSRDSRSLSGQSGKEEEYSDAETPSPKRRSCSVDRISHLSDCILVEILSRMPTKDAVKTTVLSKRWFELWTLTTRLDFSFRYDPHLDPFQVVSSILMFHKKLSLEKFSVSTRSTHHYHSNSFREVDQWVRLMTSAKVKELTLDFNEDVFDFDYDYDLEHIDAYQYKLPRHLYAAAFLTKLGVSMCILKPDGEIRWDSLKSLSIGRTILGDGELNRVLGGCPVLESLELFEFGGISLITSDNLRELIIRDNRRDRKSQKDIVISAPNLQSLKITGDMWWTNFRVLMAKSLITCHLDFCARSLDNGHNHQRRILTVLVPDLRRAKEFSIGPQCLKVLARMEVEGITSPFWSPRTKRLTLETSLNNLDLPGIWSLLQSALSLEELIINLTIGSHSGLSFEDDHPMPNGDHYWKLKKSSGNLMLHLKTIRISGVSPRSSRKSVLPLVKYLLKNARSLEQLTLKAAPRVGKNCRDEGCRPKEVVEMLTKLLKCPRLSPYAKIKFLYV